MSSQDRLTLLSAGLLDLGCLSVSYESVVWLELLHGLGGVVEEGKASALAATKLCSEAEDGDLVLGGLVERGQLLAELVLGHIGARWVEDITVRGAVLVRWLLVSTSPPPIPSIRAGRYAHDHLLASQQWVTDELARAQRNLGVGHYCGGDGREEVELRASPG